VERSDVNETSARRYFESNFECFGEIKPTTISVVFGARVCLCFSADLLRAKLSSQKVVLLHSTTWTKRKSKTREKK
jgi:hypothetical protein